MITLPDFRISAMDPRPGVTVKQGDATQPTILAPLLAGSDAVLSASQFQTSDANALITSVKKAGVKRLLVVGGAGSLEVAAGKTLVDTPDFPEAYKAESQAGVEFLSALRHEKDLDWTFLSPSAEFAPRRAHGQVPSGGRPASLRYERQELDFHGRFCHCHGG